MAAKWTKKQVVFGILLVIFAAAGTLILGASPLLIRRYGVEAFKIPSSGMEPTIIAGDHILVAKSGYGTAAAFALIKRGDIIVYTMPDDPDTEVDENLINRIQRIVAMPGDNVQLIRTCLIVNDKVVDETGLVQYVKQGNRDFGPVTVPEGMLVVFGDNRDQSKDVRFHTSPFIPIERIKGRAFYNYFHATKLFERLGEIPRPDYIETSIADSKNADCFDSVQSVLSGE